METKKIISIGYFDLHVEPTYADLFLREDGSQVAKIVIDRKAKEKYIAQHGSSEGWVDVYAKLQLNASVTDWNYINVLFDSNNDYLEHAIIEAEKLGFIQRGFKDIESAARKAIDEYIDSIV